MTPTLKRSQEALDDHLRDNHGLVLLESEEAVRAVLRALMEVDERALDAGRTAAVPAVQSDSNRGRELLEFKARFRAAIRHILGERG